MDRREELRAKARDHERKDQPEHALEVYLGLVDETPPSGLGGLWTRIGDLQERIGASSNSIDSYLRAVTAFAESGQLNNAVAVSQRILRLDPEHATAHLRLGEISLSQGYRDYARSGVGNYARLTAAADQPEAALEPLTAYLGRFPDDVDVWKDWEEALLSRGMHADVARLLERLHEALAAGGHTDAVERIGRELAGTEPGNGAGGVGEPVAPAAPTESPAVSDSTLPLLDNAVEGREDIASMPVTPLEGLESTGGGAYDLEEAEATDDLPLLGTLPELTSDRAELPELERTVPLPGVERFEPGGEAPREDAASVSPIADESVWGVTDAAGPSGGSEPSDDPGPAEGDEEESFGEGLPFLDPDLPSTPVGGEEADYASTAFDPARIAAELRHYARVDVDFTDAASHYDLGLAYKEMDRFDESLANLAMAIDGGHDPAAVLEVAAEILVRKGEFELADDLLRRVPGVGDHATPEHLGVHYWLARASEEAGRRDDARHALELVVSVDPGFRDASERLQKLV